MTPKQMVKKIRGLVDDCGSQKAAAERLMISPQYLNDILGYRREVSAQVAFAMGYERRVTFIKLVARR